MDAYDSSGRRISLLSEEGDYAYTYSNYPNSASSAYTPELTRSHSFGSQSPHRPTTPVLPNVPFRRRTSNDSQQDCGSPMSDVMVASHVHDLEALGHSSQASSHYAAPLSEKLAASGRKKYPCRLAKEFNCSKMFTTSGHASRHAKIHSEHKPIRCTYDGCSKSFTRTDNMKQHLETHFRRDRPSRDRSGRSSHSRLSDSLSRRRSDESLATSQRGRRSLSLASQGSPYPVFADISYATKMEQRPAFDRRSSGSGMDILAIAAAQIGSQMESVAP